MLGYSSCGQSKWPLESTKTFESGDAIMGNRCHQDELLTKFRRLSCSPRHILVVIIMVVALVSTSANFESAMAAQAPKITSSFSSPKCPGSTHWHMAMLEYFIDSKGTTLPRDASVTRVGTMSVQPFLNAIAKASECGVTADVDIWDMGDNIFPEANMRLDVIQAEYFINGYDAVMFRYPDHGERAFFTGAAGPAGRIVFPILPEDLLRTDVGAPYIGLLWHEWLHLAVFNAEGHTLEKGLPPDDVHYNYGNDPDYYATTIDPSHPFKFFEDFMSGHVIKDGKSYGFTKGDWISIGTSAHESTITCKKGKLVKKIIAIKAICPKGYSSLPFTPAVDADTLILTCGSDGATYSVLMPTGIAVDGRECSGSLVPDKRVKIIFQHAFSSSKLTSVTIPNSVTSIDLMAFSNSKLTSVIIPNSVTSIGLQAFFSTPLTSITIGKSVTSIGFQAFANTKLKSVIIPNSVKNIGTQAFAFNSSLTTVSFPKGLVTLGSNVLERDSSLTKINYCGTLTGFPITPTCTSK